MPHVLKELFEMRYEGPLVSKCYGSQVQEVAMEEKLIGTKVEQSVGVFMSTIDCLKSENAWTVQLDTIVRYMPDTGAQVNVHP